MSRDRHRPGASARLRDGLPLRDDLGHKGTFGAVAVVGGSALMLGAPCFAAQAALRAGAGRVLLAVPGALAQAALTLVPSAIAAPIGPDPSTWLARLPRDAVLAVGCGWGQGTALRGRLRALLASRHPLVLDADGLGVLAQLPPSVLPRRAGIVLTPHAGEYERLAKAWGLPTAARAASDHGRQRRIAAAIALAGRAGAIAVLKGADTVVSDGATTAVIRGRNAALAIPGSGDVLTGIIAGLMAQGMHALAAARLGVRVHAGAGRLWRARVGPSGLLAMQLADLVPDAMRRLRRAGG